MVGIYQIHETGGPEVLTWGDVELGAPTGKQVLVKHTAVGLNYIDTYHRSGLYPMPLPARLGVEAAGVVEAVGPEVTEYTIGDRVAYSGTIGAYGEANLVPEQGLVGLPDFMDDKVAAAAMLKGLTAAYLLLKTFPVKSGDDLLVHAGAGGVGLILCQWSKALGANIIATVGSEEKAKLAQANGADETILYREEDVVARVKAFTDGRGVNVSFDSVGESTFDISLQSLAPLGMFVSFGNSSGNAPSVNPMALMAGGSLFFTRPSLGHYTSSRAKLQELADALFTVISDGSVKIHVNQTYPLSDLVQAHKDLEARATTGSTILLP